MAVVGSYTAREYFDLEELAREIDVETDTVFALKRIALEFQRMQRLPDLAREATLRRGFDVAAMRRKR